MAAEPTKSSVLGGATVEAIADAVVTLDSEGIVTSWNPAAESLLGHPSTEMVGTTLAALIPEEFRTRHMAGFHAALDSGALKHEGRPAHVRAMTARQRSSLCHDPRLVKGPRPVRRRRGVCAATPCRAGAVCVRSDLGRSGELGLCSPWVQLWTRRG
jgi:PAS domain-containing protein